MNLTSNNIGIIRKLLELDEELCGNLEIDKLGNQSLNIINIGMPDITGKRKMCEVPLNYHIENMWHTHPRSEGPYPSVEDIIHTILYRGNKTYQIQIIFTVLGVWELTSEYKETKEIFPESYLPFHINAINDLLYMKTYNVMQFSDEHVKDYMINLKSFLKPYEFNISFTSWNDIKLS